MNIDHAKQVLDHLRKPPPWSYTSLSDYIRCPRRYFRRHVKKDLPPEDKSDAQLTGTAVHEAMKAAIRRGNKLPSAFVGYEPLVAPLRKVPEHRILAELKLGMTVEGRDCDFFAEGVWGRGALDVVVFGDNNSALLLDWKTGKSREDPFELALQALLLRSKYPEIEKVIGHYVWLRTGKLGQAHDVSDTNSTRASVDELMEEISNRLESNAWPPDENPFCGWCNVHDCEYVREKCRV